MQKSIRTRLFLVGCPRSGTTLLQSMLAAHSQIASFPESHFLVTASRSRRGRWMRKLGLVSPEMWRNFYKFLSDIGHPEMMPKSMIRLRPFIMAFIDILDQLTLREEKTHWIEKTPNHLYYIDDFVQVAADALFVHLIRKGADVVASLYEVTYQYPAQWGGSYTIDQCIHTWNQAVARSQQYCHQPNHLWVEYERLIDEPAKTLNEICDFAGVELEFEMVDMYADVAQKLILDGEAWKQNAYQPIRKTHSTKFQKIFTQGQQNRIFQQLRTQEVSAS